MITHSKDHDNIELHTQKQNKSPCWFEEHYGPITSLNFGSFFKGVMTAGKIKLATEIGLPSNKQSTSVIQWGQLHEDTAFVMYEHSLPINLTVRKAGIVILESRFLAASPDGIVTSRDNEKVILGVIGNQMPVLMQKYHHTRWLYQNQIILL